MGFLGFLFFYEITYFQVLRCSLYTQRWHPVPPLCLRCCLCLFILSYSYAPRPYQIQFGKGEAIFLTWESVITSQEILDTEFECLSPHGLWILLFCLLVNFHCFITNIHLLHKGLLQLVNAFRKQKDALYFYAVPFKIFRILKKYLTFTCKIRWH